MKRRLFGAIVLVLLFLAGCGDGGSGGGTATYTISGTVTGLSGTVVLQLNGGDDLTVTDNGSFTFATSLADGANYIVTVKTQPTGQTCTATNNSGTISGANVTDVQVTCSVDSYTVGGTVSGLSGSLVLRNNSADDLTITSDGSFTFSTPVAHGGGYDVTVKSSTGQACQVTNGSGTINGADVTDVEVDCTAVSVAPEYPTNGADWNDYVKGDGTDTACDPANDTSCRHAGELRVVEVPNTTSCTGLTAQDSLGVFNWVCDDSSSPVRMVSALKVGKYLSDLIDFSTPGWKDNQVVVYQNGTEYFRTIAGAWWSNPVETAPSDGSLDTAGTIYVVNYAPYYHPGVVINADRVALVVEPGLVMGAPASGNALSSTSHPFLWIEGAMDGSNNTGNYDVIYLASTNYSVLRGVRATNGRWTTGSRSGIHLYYSDHNIITDTKAVNNQSAGIYLENSDYNIISRTVAANNGGAGIQFRYSSNNILAEITAPGNGAGILLGFGTSPSYNVLMDITVSNNNLSLGSPYSEITIYGDHNTLMNILAVNNANSGIYVYGGDNHTLVNLAAAHNSGYSIYLDTSSSNYFSGLLKVGNNAGGNCYVYGGTNPGIDSNCNPQGSSDFTLTTGIDMTNSFVGKVTTDDSANGSDTSGTASYPASLITFDWTNFETPYRAWGIDGSAFPNADHQGLFGCSDKQYDNQTDCEANGNTWNGTGRIWDWSLQGTDNVARGVLSLPTGNDTVTHTWSDSSTTTFLRNAIEIAGDGIGNDNYLCESGETCLYTPNIGSYQGHGNLIDAGTFTDGTITGVTLKKYDTNGY